jgi:hypothetical protein
MREPGVSPTTTMTTTRVCGALAAIGEQHEQAGETPILRAFSRRDLIDSRRVSHVCVSSPAGRASFAYDCR